MKLDLDLAGPVASLEKTCIPASFKALDVNFICQLWIKKKFRNVFLISDRNFSVLSKLTHGLSD